MGAHLMPSGGGKFSRRQQPIASINMTPFIDVVLVLLIVFMVTAPMLTQGVDVDLPEVTTAPLNESQQPLEVSIKSNGQIYLQARQVPLAKLAARLKAIQGARENQTSVLLRADKNVNYGQVMSVMGHLQTAGIYNVGLVTEPPQ